LSGNGSSGPELLSITGYRLDAAAKALGLSEMGLRRALRRCAGQTVTIGNAKIITTEELARIDAEMGRLRFRPGQRRRGVNGQFLPNESPP
jgi:hypothetical protein